MTCKDCIYNELCVKQYCEDCGGLCDECGIYGVEGKKLHVKDCEHFKDRSRFVELPCKIGDKIYFVFDYRSGITEIKEVKVTYYRIRPDGFEIGTTLGYFTKADLGVDVFLTREEAERALKERENNA